MGRGVPAQPPLTLSHPDLLGLLLQPPPLCLLGAVGMEGSAGGHCTPSITLRHPRKSRGLRSVQTLGK